MLTKDQLKSNLEAKLNTTLEPDEIFGFRGDGIIVRIAEFPDGISAHGFAKAFSRFTSDLGANETLSDRVVFVPNADSAEPNSMYPSPYKFNDLMIEIMYFFDHQEPDYSNWRD